MPFIPDLVNFELLAVVAARCSLFTAYRRNIDSMTYARARLWLGISGVGFFVTASAAALWFDIPRRVLGGSSSASAIILTLTVYILLSFPLDILGGYLLPRRYRRTNVGLRSFLRSWLQGIFFQALIMGVCALFILQAASRGGTFVGIGMFVILMLCLLRGQLAVARLVGGLRQSSAHPPFPMQNLFGKELKQPEMLVYQSTDPAFVGGLVGFPGRERFVLPSAWLEHLSADVMTMQVTRRLGVIVTGARARGVGVALIWNGFGFALASQLPHVHLTNVTGLINAGLWFTLWSFVGLLLLPTLNRPGVLEADRFARNSGIGEETMERGMIDLDRLQDDEPNRSRWIERVFHPIPSVMNRMEYLQSDTDERGAWQSARITLYLSWVCFGFLSRAVHCNVGRPELWVLFPGD
jgi:hypothetical protein